MLHQPLCSQICYGSIHLAYCRFQTLCLVKERHRNKTKEQKSPNEWACFVEEKVEVLKSLIRCSEKSFQLLKKKKKKETKFYFEGCVPRTSPLIFFKTHLSCLFHSSLEVNRFRECTATIETFHRRTETDCSVSALLVYFNQKALKFKKRSISVDILLELEYGVQNTECYFDLLLNVSKLLLLLWAARRA